MKVLLEIYSGQQSIRQWQLGSGYNPFQRSYMYSHDKTKWLKEIRSFAQKNQITISIGHTSYPLLRENDQYPMEAAEEAGFCDSALLFISYYRIYHHVLTCPKRESLSRFRFIQEIQKSLKIN
jgi:hypothetical protein